MTIARSPGLEHGFGAHLGIKIDAAGPAFVAGHMMAGDQHLNEAGHVHGGVLMSLADVVAAHATMMHVPKGCSTITIESKSNFLRAGREGRIHAEATPLHIGRSTMVWQTTVKNDREQVLAMTTQTQLTLASGRAGVEPVASPTASDTPVDPVPAAAQNGAATATADLRRAQIFKAAFTVIARKGFASATMREIAQAAEMPVPTMYQYVRSKDELLEGIFDDYLNQVRASMQLSGSGAKTPREKLRAAIETNIAEFDRFQSQIRLMNRETRSVAAEVRERIKHHMLSYISLFRDIIQEGVDTGEFRQVNVDMYANFIPMLCEVWPLRGWAVGHHGVQGIRDGITDMALSALARTED